MRGLTMGLMGLVDTPINRLGFTRSTCPSASELDHTNRRV